MHAAMSSLKKLRREKNADCIAVAHHKEDQAETFLFRLIRGSSARGLAAMLPKRDFIIRPLLFAEKGDILCVFRGEKDTVAGGYYESGYSVSEKLDSEGVTATVKRELKSGCGGILRMRRMTLASGVSISASRQSARRNM